MRGRYRTEKGLSRYATITAMRAEDPMQAPELRLYMAAKFAADALLRISGVPYATLNPCRLTDEPVSQQFSASLEGAGDKQISRVNVAYALLHTVQDASITHQEFTLLDGK